MAKRLSPPGQDLLPIGGQGEFGVNQVMRTKRLHIPAEAMAAQMMFQGGCVKAGFASVNVYDFAA